MGKLPQTRRTSDLLFSNQLKATPNHKSPGSKSSVREIYNTSLGHFSVKLTIRNVLVSMLSSVLTKKCYFLQFNIS